MTIVIPVFTTIIPIYAMFSKYKLLDSKFWLSVIYISACLPINTWTMKNYFDLTGYVAVVTGASAGLGLQMARAFAVVQAYFISAY